MEFNFKKARWSEDENGTWLMLLAPDKKTVQEFVLSLTDILYQCTIKPFKAKRSLNANNYSYALSDKLADALRISKEECHFMMLKRYGQKTVVSVIKEAAETFKQGIEYYEVIGDSEMNGKAFEHIKVYKGSRFYDTKEMSIFVDGIVSECKEQGIPTMTPSEIQQLKERWSAK